MTHARTPTRTNTRAHAHAHTHAPSHARARARARAHARTRARMHAHAHTPTRTHARTRERVHAHTHALTHTHTHTHARARARAHARTRTRGCKRSRCSSVGSTHAHVGLERGSQSVCASAMPHERSRCWLLLSSRAAALSIEAPRLTNRKLTGEPLRGLGVRRGDAGSPPCYNPPPCVVIRAPLPPPPAS